MGRDGSNADESYLELLGREVSKIPPWLYVMQLLVLSISSCLQNVTSVATYLV